MKKQILTKILWLGTLPMAMAQVNDQPAWSNFATASPDHSYIATQVNEATGQPQIAIPLFNLSHYGFNQQIALYYHSGGFKVDESASRIGMGWNLSIGGSITKVVCGLPDEVPLAGYNTTAAQTGINGVVGGVYPSNNSSFDNIYKGILDGESDYYVYNAPGLSGKFFLNEGNTYSMPYNSTKIEGGTFLGVPNSFRITDPNGVLYYFTETEYVEVRDKSSNDLLYIEMGNTKLLKKIVLNNGQEINFNYGSEFSYTVNGGTSQDQVFRLPNGNSCAISSLWASYVATKQLKYKYRTKKLEQVTFPLGEVDIVYNTEPRLDIAGDNAISSLVLKNKNGNQIKQFVLNQYYVGHLATAISGRLMLGSIQEFGANGIDSKPPYVFNYNSTTLPDPGSCSQDLYGYYNGEVVYWNNSSTEQIQTMLPFYSFNYTLSSTQIYNNQSIYGATRAINPSYSNAQTLISITYPGGGKTIYDFEQNTTGTGNTLAPGLRIKKITTHDGNGEVGYKHFSYSQGVLISYVENQVQSYYREMSPGCTVRSFKRYSMPGKTVPGIFDAPVYYHTVTMKESSDANGLNTHGAVVSTYYAEEMLPPQLPVATNPLAPYAGNTGILHLKPFFYGSLLNRKVYKNDMTTLIDETTYEYNSDEANAKSAKYSVYPRLITAVPGGVNTYYRIRVDIPNYFAVKMYSQIYHLNKVIHKSYGTQGSEFVSTQNEYFYEPNASAVHLLPVQSKTSYEDGSSISTFYKRVADYNSNTPIDAPTAAIQQLKDNNRLGAIIEQLSWKNAGSTNPKLLSGSLHEYVKPDPASSFVNIKREYNLDRFLQSPSSTFVPSNILSGSFYFDSHYKKMGEVDLLNAQGEVLSQNIKGYSSCVLMSPLYGSPYARASNASSGEFAYAGFEDAELDINALPGTSTSSGYYVFGNWKIPMSSTPTLCPTMSNTAFAGSNSFNLKGCNYLMNTSALTLNPTRKYKLSLWCKNGIPLVAIGNTVNIGTLLQTTDGWNLYEYEFNGVSTIMIQGDCLLDEIKLRPVDSSIETDVININGLKVAESDNNNNYVFYEYDALNRPIKLLDHQKNIIRKLDYSIQQAQY